MHQSGKEDRRQPGQQVAHAHHGDPERAEEVHAPPAPKVDEDTHDRPQEQRGQAEDREHHPDEGRVPATLQDQQWNERLGHRHAREPKEGDGTQDDERRPEEPRRKFAGKRQLDGRSVGGRHRQWLASNAVR